MISSDIEWTFLISPKILNIALKNSSGAHFTPTPLEIYWKNRQNGIIKVVSFFDPRSSFIWQCRDSASTVVNHLSSWSLETTSSNVDVTKSGLCMALFKSFGSRYNLTDPIAIETHTNEFPNEVSCVAGDEMPCFIRESIYALNLSLSDTGIAVAGEPQEVFGCLCLWYIPWISIPSH